MLVLQFPEMYSFTTSAVSQASRIRAGEVSVGRGILHIIVTCTDRKRGGAPKLRARDLPRDLPIDRRLDMWVETLDAVPGAPMPASDLYLGDHWRVASSLPHLATARGIDARLWIASAGYGLVSPGSMLVPYAATFAPRVADSVAHVGDARDAPRRWWDGLARWRGPESDTPRTLAQLAGDDARSAILIVVSAAYLAALASDAEAAAMRLRRRESLMIVSAGASPEGPLASQVLPADARLQSALGGTRQSLNVRIARWLIEHAEDHQFDPTDIHRCLADELEKQPALERFDRKAIDDDEVRAYIAACLSENAQLTKSVLLRRLRDDGYACEQRRFGELFTSVAGRLR